MQLEPWEIELRQQLGLEQQINTSDTVASTKIDFTNGTMTFVFLLIVLACATLYVYDDKTGGHFKNWTLSHFHTNKIESPSSTYPVDPVEPKITQPIEPSFKDAEIAKIKNELTKFNLENKTKYDEITAKLNVTSHKVGLMGVILNENFNILDQNKNVHKLMFFNRDWTLDRMPSYIELSEDDIEYLKKFVKEGQ